MTADEVDPGPTTLDRALAGDPAAWDELVAQYENLVWAVIRSFDLSDADALDVGQLTWLRLVEKLHTIREPDRIGSWLMTTAKRECLKVLNRQKRILVSDHAGEFGLLLEPKDQFRKVEDRDTIEHVFDAFGSLGHKCQALLRLVLAEPPPSYVEISDLLEIPVGTIGPRRKRCLSELRTAAGL